MKSFFSLFTAVCVTALFAAHAHGGVSYHTVKSGESLSSIAASFYGQKDKYKLVALYNNIDHPEKIRPGTRIRLPYSDRVTLKQGESLSAIAKMVWKKPWLYPVIAKANGISRPEKVSAGTSLYVPVLVPYRLGQSETLSTVARDILGDLMAYEQIALASDIKDPGKVPIGTRIKVPVVIKLARRTSPYAPPKQKTASLKKRIPAPAARNRISADLKTLTDSAEKEFRKGNYQNAKSILLKVENRLVTRKYAGALRTLAQCHYAYGDNTLALKTLVKAYRLDPAFEPEPAMVNPELMSMYRKAKDQVKQKK